jgi:ParB/RepB/Spo0J family partition protein
MLVASIPLTAITIGVQMIRHDDNDDDITELAADIAARGLMQPIGVAPVADGTFQLLWGSRRLAAHRKLRAPTIAARICAGTMAEEIVSTAARENLLRRDLTLREEIDAVRGFANEGRSANQISDLVGKSRDWVNRRLAFDALPANVREYVLSGDLPLGHGEVLALIEDPGTQQYLLTHCLQHRPSLVSLRATAQAIEASPAFVEAIEAGTTAAQPSLTTPTARLDCYACDDATPVTELVVIRCCAQCATAIRSAISKAENTDAQHGPQ